MRTAARHRLPPALGWLSLGLGATQVAAPDAILRLVGAKPTDRTRLVVRAACGARELMAGAGLVRRRSAAGWLWARVAGDAIDLALLGATLRSAKDRDRVGRSLAAVAGITAVDVVAAARRATPGRGAKVEVKSTVTVNRPPEEVYRYWRDVENLPTFMYHLESVETTGPGRSHWRAKAPAKTTVEWDAEIVDDRPGQLIAWRSVNGGKVANAGTVRFSPAPAGQGTEVVVELEYTAPGGPVGAVVAKLFGEEPSQQVRDDLRRFKQVLETGEVVVSDGSPDGSRVQRQLHQREARPLETTKGSRS